MNIQEAIALSQQGFRVSRYRADNTKLVFQVENGWPLANNHGIANFSVEDLLADNWEVAKDLSPFFNVQNGGRFELNGIDYIKIRPLVIDDARYNAISVIDRVYIISLLTIKLRLTKK